jgi:hypothetical protein
VNTATSQRPVPVGCAGSYLAGHELIVAVAWSREGERVAEAVCELLLTPPEVGREQLNGWAER